MGWSGIVTRLYERDHIMRQLQQLSGQEYADVYAAEVKKALAEGGDSSPHNP